MQYTMFYLHCSCLEEPLLEKEKGKAKCTLLKKRLPSVSTYLSNVVRRVYKKSRLKRFKVLGLYNAIYWNYIYKLLILRHHLLATQLIKA